MNNITKTIKERNRDFKELWYSRIEPTMLGHSISGKKIWDTDPDDEDSYMYVGETLEHYLLQSQIRLLEAVIGGMEEQVEELYSCLRHRRTHSCNGCPQILKRPIEDWAQTVLRDQISSLNETLEFLKKSL